VNKLVIFLIVSILIILPIGITKADSGSLEKEILEILKEKQIITPEKYQELSQKLAAGSKNVEEEILDLLKEQKIITEARHQELKEKARKEKEQQAKLVELPEGLKGVQLKGTWYIDYRAGEKSDNTFNEFNLTRGYIDLRKQLTPWLSGRITPDITQDETGDYKLRLKYLYGNIILPDLKGVLTKNYIEVGMIHMPWLDFEEEINPYRCQGTMFLERNSMFNSADLGIGVFGYFGGEMPEEYKKKVNDHFAGRYGSYAFGVYNGGGYHAKENNENKAFEGRISLRPLPDFLPGLQISYFNITGKGNLKEGEKYYLTPNDALAGIKKTLTNPPDWRVHNLFLSYENPWGALTGQYFWGKGAQKGKYTLEAKEIVDERDKEGFSLFGYVRSPWDKRLRLFGRYDYWDPDTDESDDKEKRYLGGVSFDLYKGVMLILDYEHLDLPKNRPNEHFLQTVLQIKY